MGKLQEEQGVTARSADPTQACARPVLVHLSPLPHTRNGIADYAATILLELIHDYECIAVVENPSDVSEQIRSVCHVLSYEQYNQVIDELRHERHIAHIGNNTDHIPIINVISDVPSAVVLHDLTLHYLMERWAQDMYGSIQFFRSTILALHGPQGAELVDAKHFRKVPVQSVYSELSCLPLLNDTAAALITHSLYGHVLARSMGYSNPVRVVPHFAKIPDPDLKARRRAAFRKRYGIDSETTVYASLGFVTPNKIISAVLNALSNLPKGMSDWCYVIGGENRDPHVMDLIRTLPFQGRVIVLNYLPEEEFDTVLAAADAVINLRVPTSGETSGTVCRALAFGLPCIVNNHGWYAELPDAATWKVDPSLEGCMRELPMFLIRSLLCPDERVAKSEAALAYARDTLDLDRVVESYREVIEEAHARRQDSSVPTPPTAAPLRFAPRESFSTIEITPDVLLSRLLMGEVVSQPAADVRRIAIPAAGPQLDWISHEAEAPALTQAFAAVEVEDGIGGMVLAATDAACLTETGDLFTLAVIARKLPIQHPPLMLSSRPLFQAVSFDDDIAKILTDAGFQVLRRGCTDVPPAEPEGGFCQIILMTARKVSQTAPIMTGFSVF